MAEDKVWSTVYHDLQMQTSVVGNGPGKYSVLQLNYSATMDQISAITSSAEYCEQYISYSCKMSRLLNTPGRLRVKCHFITNSAGVPQ
ncbi:inactive rhomboid protein 2 [Platysternon megacephalum]|uniref:Inactive rhomboid protein 2 n=1 Tax=Platysternon megacephalum TaxID=55544 RepID=A0A4D9E3Q0_9SAUR|nr:inactive rhomboid protein 2 [Platysternon megacephalum]